MIARVELSTGTCQNTVFMRKEGVNRQVWFKADGTKIQLNSYSGVISKVNTYRFGHREQISCCQKLNGAVCSQEDKGIWDCLSEFSLGRVAIASWRVSREVRIAPEPGRLLSPYCCLNSAFSGRALKNMTQISLSMLINYPEQGNLASVWAGQHVPPWC